MTAVYVIAAEGGPVKVGMAIDPERRLQSLRTGTPFRLHLAHVEDTGDLSASKIERATHALLDAARTHGEWFDVTVDEAREAIQRAVVSLRQVSPPTPLPVVEAGGAIVPSQCRAARGLVTMSQQDLSDASRVSLSTIRNFEAGRSIPMTNNLAAMRAALEAAGVIFIPENGDGPGVKLRRKDG